MWTGVAAVGVFWFGSDHSWRMAFLAALFCTVVCGGLFLTLNWAAGDRGQKWGRQHIGLVLSVYAVALLISASLKLLAVILHK